MQGVRARAQTRWAKRTRCFEVTASRGAISPQAVGSGDVGSLGSPDTVCPMEPTITSRAVDTDGIEYFARKLRYETDPTDVAAAIEAGGRFAFVDTRGHAAWHQGRARGAVHIPRAEIAERAPAEIPAGTPVVVYCWGPACNGATRSAIEFLKLGYPVKEMIGGFEYWAREGLPVEDDLGPVERATDPLTAPVAEPGCDC